MSRAVFRGLFIVVLVVAAGTLALSWKTGPSAAAGTAVDRSGSPPEDRGQIRPEQGNITVITTDPPGSSGGQAAIVAYTDNGRMVYRNDTYGNYFDVDPDPPGSLTVLYVGGNRYDQCPTALEARASEPVDDGCAEIAVERANLSTGETERVHTAVTDWDIWHDVDRVGEERLLVADLAEDRVFILDTATDAIEWEWRAENDLSPDSGGRAGDWTHLNDVERLADGRTMVSLRNQDRVVFLDADGNLLQGWTLGAEDAYSVLYEQHNPDYIPPERGGPAILVADSENNRVVEYERAEGRWTQSWAWQDETLRWPRDADRLPNGHTLVTDSQGNRVVEVDENDEVVWSVHVPTPYEAERLGTDDESATGWSKTALDDGNSPETGSADRPGQTTGLSWIVSFVSGPLINGLLYVAPTWVTVKELVLLLVLGATSMTWVTVELYWYRFNDAHGGNDVEVR